MSPPPGAPPEARRVLDALLPWYGRAARDLPWRRPPDRPEDRPWRVLLSEAMLQQTRVETVIPYFERFVARWPTVADFAAAPEEDVLHAWSGLGYYSRARNLHRAAKAAAATGFPRTAAGLRALPGVGPYTAGAVASIAFGERAPLVDGNVERVLCRLDRRAEDPRGAGKRALWDRVGALHAAASAEEHPGDLNQALMELGATVCTPRAPGCAGCPVGALCVGRDAASTLPAKAPKAPPKAVVRVAAIARSAAGTWLVRRPETGLFAGLWEPPSLEVPAGGDPAATALAAGWSGAPMPPVRHVLTHRRLEVHRVATEVAPGVPSPYVAGAWVGDPESVPLSELARKLLATRGP